MDTFDAKGMKAFKEEMKAHQHTEELRLGYVTFTRPRSLLLGSGHWWGPSQKRTRGPSAFLEALYEHCAAGHGEIEVWADEPAEDEENPALAAPDTDRAWPLPLDPTALARRRAARDTVLAHLERLAVQGDEQPPAYAPEPDDVPAYGSGPEHAPAYEPWDDEPPLDEPPADEGWDWDALPTERPAGMPDPQDAPATDPEPASEPVRESAAESVREPAPAPEAPPHELPHPHIPAARHPQEEPADRLTPEEARTLASWDRDLDALAGELRRARATVHDVLVPASLSATQLLLLADDPDAFAKELARPMPRPPQPAARRGTRFHAWVESRYEELPLPMLGPDELPGGDESDVEIADERDLAELKEAFERTAYARRTPYRVETPFQITLAGRVIRGRIDAVYRTGDTYEIVDWKTTHHRTADPLQLAVYRLAWAELHDLPLDAVTATFLYVRSGETVHPQGLPGRAELERILLDEPVPGDG